MPEEIDNNSTSDGFVEDVTTQAQGSGQQVAQHVQGQKPAVETPKPEEWKQAIADLATQVKTATAPKEEKKEMSPEEQAKFWGIYDPTNGGARKDFFQKFFRFNPDATPEEVEDAKALFADMQKGIVRQSIIGARNLMAEEIAKLREEFSPAQEYASQARAEKTREKFFKAYPGLYEELEDGNNRYARAIDRTAKSIENQEFEGEKEYFKALAEGAAEMIKDVNPDFNLGAAKQKQPAGTTPRLPRTRVGGTGGTGAAATVGAKNGSGDDSGAIDWS